MTGSTILLGDWGTTRLRLFACRNGAVIDRIDGPGIGQVPAAPAVVLDRLLAAWPGVSGAQRLILCGMAGSRNGLAEVPYADCPVDVAGWARAAHRMAAPPQGQVRDILIAGGVACDDITTGPDVMRGEETQIFGALSLDPALGRGQHLIVLPGTHSKWAVIKDGAIVRFRTWLTGELYALLVDQSTLLRAGAGEPDPADGFATGLSRSGAGVIGALFGARSAQLRSGATSGWAGNYLSGLLIGTEIAEGLAAFGPIDRVVTIGDAGLCHHYHRAFEHAGVAYAAIDGEQCALAGLDALRHALAAQQGER